LESLIKKDNFQEIIELWNEFNSLKEENDEMKKIFEMEINNSRKMNNESSLNLKSNKSENIIRNSDCDVILYSYRKDNEKNKKNAINLYQSCISVRNNRDEKIPHN